MDINQRIDQVELTLVDLLQKSDQVEEYIRQVIKLATSIENKTDIAGQAMIKLLEEEIYQPDISAKINDLSRQFVDLIQNQQHLLTLLQTPLGKSA